MAGGLLVVGGDSLVGAAVAQHAATCGIPVVRTTRRPEGVHRGSVYLDLAQPDDFICPEGIGTALIAAAVTPYQRCATDPLAQRVNVDGPAELALRLAAGGVFVVYLSSNTVFGGDRPFCNEDDEIAPRFAYAEQKAGGELALAQALREHPQSWCTVRLTKVLAPSVPPLPDWERQLASGQCIRPFTDLVFAPVSRQYVAAALVRIAQSHLPGRFHLSGQDNVSYAAFARALVAARGLAPGRVQATTAAAAGVSTAFQPRYSALGMARTQRSLGLTPQPLAAVVQDLLAA